MGVTTPDLQRHGRVLAEALTYFKGRAAKNGITWILRLTAAAVVDTLDSEALGSFGSFGSLGLGSGPSRAELASDDALKLAEEMLIKLRSDPDPGPAGAADLLEDFHFHFEFDARQQPQSLKTHSGGSELSQNFTLLRAAELVGAGASDPADGTFAAWGKRCRNHEGSGGGTYLGLPAGTFSGFSATPPSASSAK